jgi:O-antigen/teichoic acid export membrane protein
MNVGWQEISGIITIVLTVLVYVPLIVSTVKGNLKPHPITWFIQTLSLGTSGFILLFNDAHAGTWALLSGAVFCLIVTIVSFKNYRKLSRFSRKDFLFLFLALSALFLWLLSRDLAIISVTLLTAASIFGFIPTFIKTWKDPRSESFYTWLLFLLIVIFGIAATAHFDFINLLQRVVGGFINSSLILIMVFRRRKIPSIKKADKQKK